jgi:shikimate dehydrogenase
MIRAGVIGRPIVHSLSPLIHGAWIEAAGLDAEYGRYTPDEGESFAACVARLRAAGLKGLNVTLPFKEEALALADEASEIAQASGAANLLTFEAGRVRADNTDGIGLMAALAEQAPDLDIAGRPVVLLGAGGAARGALAALVGAGAEEIRVLNRTLERAEALAERDARAYALPLGWAAQAFGGAGLVVNATAAGLSGAPELDLPLHALPSDAVVMDMVYKPLETGLLRAARARGLVGVDGLAMLIGQAVPSFEAFFGRPPTGGVDVRALCLQALGPAASGLETVGR